MKRRDFLHAGALGGAASVLGGQAFSATTDATGQQANGETPKLKPADIYIPGYALKTANYQGVPALDHPQMRRAIPSGYDGKISMLTKFSTDGSVRQNLFPVRGHDIAISSDGKTGVFGSMERQSYVTFDPETLDLVALGTPFGPDWVGGGHGIYLTDGTLALSERAPIIPYTGKPEDHFGRITLRDPQTMKIIGDFSTHGISPHEIRMLDDGTHAVIANYGTTVPPGGGTDYGLPRHMVEASVVVVDIHSGKLVEKYFGNETQEIRHLCAKDAETIFAIQAELVEAGSEQHFFSENKAVYGRDPTNTKGMAFTMAPTVKVNTATGRLETLGSDARQQLMRHGLSIEYDARNDEVIASYPATHTVLVFDAPSGEVKQQINCEPIGLHYPCGVALLPGQDFYVVTGYWRNLYIFERGTHRLIRELCHYPVNFGHSHIVAV